MVQDWVQREVFVAHGAGNLVRDRYFFTIEWLSAILEYLWSMEVAILIFRLINGLQKHINSREKNYLDIDILGDTGIGKRNVETQD